MVKKTNIYFRSADKYKLENKFFSRRLLYKQVYQLWQSSVLSTKNNVLSGGNKNPKTLVFLFEFIFEAQIRVLIDWCPSNLNDVFWHPVSHPCPTHLAPLGHLNSTLFIDLFSCNKTPQSALLKMKKLW